jgi:hypothetical protein
MLSNNFDMYAYVMLFKRQQLLYVISKNTLYLQLKCTLTDFFVCKITVSLRLPGSFISANERAAKSGQWESRCGALGQPARTAPI